MHTELDLYNALHADAGRLKGLRRLQYRCSPPNRCLLLDAIEIGGDVLIYRKRYKLSDAANETRSSAAGRAKNTYDGRNHYLERAYWIGNSGLAYDDLHGVQLSCDHMQLDRLLAPADFRADWEARHAEVIVRPDGSRYAS